MQLSTKTQRHLMLSCLGPRSSHYPRKEVMFLCVLCQFFAPCSVGTGVNSTFNSPYSFFSARAFLNVPVDHTIIIISTSPRHVPVKFMLLSSGDLVVSYHGPLCTEIFQHQSVRSFLATSARSKLISWSLQTSTRSPVPLHFFSSNTFLAHATTQVVVNTCSTSMSFPSRKIQGRCSFLTSCLLAFYGRSSYLSLATKAVSMGSHHVPAGTTHIIVTRFVPAIKYVHEIFDVLHPLQILCTANQENTPSDWRNFFIPFIIHLLA